MSQRNGYAALVRQRSSGETKRRKLDDYETPDDVTARLVQHVKLGNEILEPACGSGRMVKALRATLRGRMGSIKATCSIVGTDITQGHDFLKRTAKWRGDIVTNPPYRDNLAEKFTRHALKLADGKVCMLVQSGFIWGDKRAAGLFAEVKPCRIVVIPERIYFLVNGKPIDSQFFTHAWVCWPDRKTREKGGYQCPTIWATKDQSLVA